MFLRLPLMLAGLLLALHTSAQTTLLRGAVLDGQSNAPVPFASVGVPRQALGTVADAEGRFQFRVPDSVAARMPRVLVSCVGYQTADLPLSALQAAAPVVRLAPLVRQLASVTVRAGKQRVQTFGRTAGSTFMTSRLYTEPGLVSDELAKEQGTLVPLAPDCHLRDFHMLVAFNRFKSVTFRLNLYSVKNNLPDQPLLTQDVRFTVEQPRGWVKVDLEPYQLYLRGHREVAVTVQWLHSEAAEGQAKAFGIAAVPQPSHSILTRDKSQAQWQETKPGYLSLYLTADVYRPAKPDQPAPADYVLPDSLRYLQQLQGPALAELDNPEHYGSNTAIGNTIAVPGGQLYYERYGRGNPLLLLHGNGQSIAAFQKQIGELARHFEVIAVDTRAHGHSPDYTTAPLTYDLFAEDVRLLLDSLHLPRVDVLGWSDGGNTALKLALAHPSRVRRLAIMGANLFPTAEAIAPDFLALLRRQLREAEQHPEASQPHRARLIRLLLQEPQLAFQAMAAIKVPVLVMAGEKDVVLEKHTRALARSLHQGQLRIFPGATHYAPQEVPEQFNEALLTFLRKP
ncbi:alpha/beta fold hydrolase [Hymenobacter guriensis]|uniref:Alpha/beta fold hydrolase n=1 Tax=Hymenobacter guriensis TaxID=2793065 RepID=A0ABS0L3J6_9BACT|nr:alpha/beta fold hydrolase [Hymenobacter guriensis]MBG8554705.1 alpha/beta fold hydrolase [Hymenobacter guriensis]